LARASPWALGEELFAESQQKFSAKNSSLRAKKTLGEEFFVESISSALSKEIFLKLLFHLQTFSILNMHLYKGYVQI
jgi:hypothetical protein